MATRKQIADNQRMLYDDAVENNMFQAAVPTFVEFQRRLEGDGYRRMVFDNYRKHGVTDADMGFDTMENFRGRFGGSYYADDNKKVMSNNAQDIVDTSQRTLNNSKRYQQIKQRKENQQKNNFGRIDIGDKHNAFGAENVMKDDFAYNPNMKGFGTYLTSNGIETGNEFNAGQNQQEVDSYDKAWREAVDTGEIPSAFDVVDNAGNYDLCENVGKNGTHVTEEGNQRQLDARLNDANKRLQDINDAIDADNQKNGNPLLSYSAQYGGGNNVRKDRKDLAISRLEVEDEIRSLEAVRSKEGWNILRGMNNTLGRARTWDFGVTDFALMGEMEQIKSKIENKQPLTARETQLAKSNLGATSAAALEDKEMGRAYRWTKIAGQSVPYMLDFFLTGGFGGITRATSRALLKYAAKQGMSKLTAGVLKSTGVVAADILGAAAMATTEQFFRTGADIMKRHTGDLYQDENGNYKYGTFDANGNLIHEGGEDFGTALYKGVAAATIENYTEKIFGHMKPPKQGFRKVLKRFGIDGLLEEIMEEEINIPLNAIFVGDQKMSDLLDPKQQADIVGGMLFSVGSMYAVGSGGTLVDKTYNTAQYYRYKHMVDKADKLLSLQLGEEEWNALRDRIENTENKDISTLMTDVLQDESLGANRKAVLDFIGRTMLMRGYNYGSFVASQAKGQEGATPTPAEQRATEQSQAYAEGQAAQGSTTHDIQQDANLRAHNLAEMLGITEQQLDQMDDETLEAMTGEDDALDMAIYDYQTSNARYQGVIDNANNSVDTAGAMAAAQTDLMTDKSRGTIRHATIKGVNGQEDSEVFILSGHIATHEDGTIDISGSDKMILYFDPATGKVENADATRCSALGAEDNAEEVKAKAVDDAKRKAMAEATRNIDGRVEVGSTFTILDGQGNEREYSVLADNGDGTVSVSIDGNVVQDYFPTLSDLQDMRDKSDGLRLTASEAGHVQHQAEQKLQTEVDKMPFDRMIDDDGKVKPVAVDGEETKINFITGKQGNRIRVTTIAEDGSVAEERLLSADKLTPQGEFSVDEYKEVLAELAGEQLDSTASVENSGENGKNTAGQGGNLVDNAVAETGTNNDNVTTARFADGTPIPVDNNGEVDFDNMSPEHAAEWYDTNLDKDAQDIIDNHVAAARTVLNQAKSKKVSGKTSSELLASKKAKEDAIAAAQAQYDNAVAVANAYQEYRKAQEEQQAAQENSNNENNGSNENIENAPDGVSEQGGTVEGDMPFAPSDTDEALPLSASGDQVASREEREESVKRNAVGSEGVSEFIIPKSLQKAIAAIANQMGAKVQYLYTSDQNGWYDKETNTVYLVLDATRALQFVFGHEMTHEIKANNPAAYENLKAIIKDAFGADWEKKVDETEALYRSKGANYKSREDYEEEVVADGIGELITNFNLAKGIAFKLDHPTLAAIRDALIKIKRYLMGEENRRINKVIDIIENAYVSTAKGERNTQETDAGQRFLLREQNDAVTHLNSAFNENLQKQIDGELESGFVYEMGMPSVYLQSTGIPNLPIRLQASVLNKKSNDPNHLYDLAEIKDLVQLMQKPIAIFAYGDKGKAQNLMIGISQQTEGEGKQFLVGISINPTVKGKELQINSIRNVFPKNYHDWVHWINQGKLLRADGKEEIQGILNALRINPVDYVSEEDLDSAAKIVKDFDNPTISDENFAGDVEQPASFEEFLQSPGIQFAIRTPEETEERIKQPLSGKDRKDIMAIGKALGINVEFVDTLPENGRYIKSEKRLLIAMDAQNPLEVVFGHEATHAIRKMSEDSYKALRDALKAIWGDKAWLNQTKYKRFLYDSNGYSLGMTEEEIMDNAEEEVVADAVGLLIRNQEMLHNLAYRLDHPTLAKIQDVLRKILSLLTERGLSEEEANVSNAVKTIDKAFSDAKKVSQQLGGEIETDHGSLPSRASVRSHVDGAGFEAIKNDGSGNFALRGQDGTIYNVDNPITVDALKAQKNTPLAYMMADARALETINKKSEDMIWRKYADMLNAYLEKGSKENGGFENLANNWQYIAESVFKTVATNSDAQYSYSLDITRICKKNEAVINGISEMQKREGYGITPGQIMELYLQSREAGYQVPCPVCYVFSRYIRNGKYATIMINGQRKYGSELVDPSTLTEEQKAEKVAYWLNELKKAEQNNEEHKKKLENANKDITELLKQIDNISVQVTRSNLTEEEEADMLAKVEALDERYRNALNLVSQGSLDSWITNFAIEKKTVNGKETWQLREDSWQQFPEEIALDLRQTAVAMREYPGIQRYRKSRGAAAGKEITMVSNNEIGDVVLAVGSDAAVKALANPREMSDEEWNNLKGKEYGELMGGAQNLYVQASKESDPKKREELLKAARKRFASAKVYAEQQSLRGGQRMWSWSDHIERLAPDVFVNLMQMDLLGGALQSYSKQLEGINMVAALNGYVNGSLMGDGKGYREVDPSEVEEIDGKLYLKTGEYTIKSPDGMNVETVRGDFSYTDKNGKTVIVKNEVYRDKDGKLYTLTFDPIVGIDFFGRTDENGQRKKGLLELNNELDRAGNIIVGMNDIHVRASMADDRIFFIIPWHSSGANNHILNQMYNILKVVFNRSTDATDYTNVQEEKKVGAKTKVSAELAEFWESHKGDFACGIKGGVKTPAAGQSLTQSQEHYRQLHDAVLVGVNVNGKKMNIEDAAKVDSTYKKWWEEISGDEFLSQAHRKIKETVSTGFMTSGDTKYIYPYEYWDEESTYSTADVNTARYLEYCRRLGYKPKFCGTLNAATIEQGRDFGNFMDDKGAWKLLIDRRMYDTRGRFQDLTPVDVSGFTTNLVDPAYTEREFDVTRVADDAGTKRLVDAAEQKERERFGGALKVDYNLTLDEAAEAYAESLNKTKGMIDKEGNVKFQVRESNPASLGIPREMSRKTRSHLAQLTQAASTIKNWLAKGKRGKVFTLRLPLATQQMIQSVMGRNFKSHTITANGIAHALKNHGENGNKLNENSIPLRPQDMELIPYIMTAPDEVREGTTDITGRISLRFYKNLSNGYVVVAEKEYKNSPDDMETITMWAEMSSPEATNAHRNAPDTHAQNAILSTEDAAKIRKDAEMAIKNEENNEIKKPIRSTSFKNWFGDWENNHETASKIVADAKANGTYMKAPNGKDTNLDEEQWVTVRTQNFKDWFGDWENDPENASKVVDENGEPMVVYHGSGEAEFNTFEKGDIGYHFGNYNQALMRNYMTVDHEGVIRPFYLSVKNPLRLDGDVRNWNGNAMARSLMDEEGHEGIGGRVSGKASINPFTSEADMEELKRIAAMGKEESNDAMREFLMGKGYDGIVYKNEVEVSPDEADTNDSVIAFSPNQIKSATDNNGDFSKDNDDIRYSVRDNRPISERIEDYDKKNGTELGRFVRFTETGQLGDGESRHFKVAKAGNLLQTYGIVGNIMASTNTVNSHHTEDADHNLTSENWLDAIQGINTPLAITKNKDGNRKYRVYTTAIVNGKTVCLALQVRTAGFNTELTNIKTAFAKDVAKALETEDVLYPADEKQKEKIIESYSSNAISRRYTQSPSLDAKVGNNSETTKQSGEKFSVREPKTMFGMHNISLEKLRKAIRQGGFAAPSMGVVDMKNGVYSDYGAITLIPKAEKLAKSTGKNAGTFTADGWTPSYPRVYKRINKSNGLFQNEMSDLWDNVDHTIGGEVQNAWENYLDGSSSYGGMYWHFLHDTGRSPKIVPYSLLYGKKISKDVMSLTDNRKSISNLSEADKARLMQMLEQHTGKPQSVAGKIAQLEEGLSDLNEEQRKFLQNYIQKLKKDEEGEDLKTLNDFVRRVAQDVRKAGSTDVIQTLRNATEKVQGSKKLMAEFEDWVAKKEADYGVEEMLFNGFTPSGYKKYIPNTIENAVKLMKQQNLAGSADWAGGIGGFIAKLSPMANTLSAMKAAKDKLVPFKDPSHDKVRNEIAQEYHHLANVFRTDNSYTDGEEYMHILAENKPSDVKDYIKRKFGVDVSDEWAERYNNLVKKIEKDYPVYYFETKFMRPYGLDEFEKAVVPKGTPKDVTDALKKAGIKVTTYKDNEDRQRAIMDAVNSSDDIKFMLAGERGAAAADRAEEVTTRIDNLDVARQMEEAGKDAKAIKMATGWERGADGKWRYEMEDVVATKYFDYIKEKKAEIDAFNYGIREKVDELRRKRKSLKPNTKAYNDNIDKVIALEKQLKRYTFKAFKLSDIIDKDHPLLKAYPELGSISVRTKDLKMKALAQLEYNNDTGEMAIKMDTYFAMSSPDELASSLAHEVQHAIQYLEGFARGGNEESAIPAARKKIMSDIEALMRSEEWLEHERLYEENRDNVSWDDPIVAKMRGLKQSLRSISPEKAYRQLAGEVEARNVGRRMSMTPEERRASLASETEDIAREDQIFLFGENGVSAMGSRVANRMRHIANELEGRELSDEQRAVADVFSGKTDNNRVHVTTENGEQRTVIMRQGNENHAGTKHCIFRHFGTNNGYISSTDIIRIPEVLKEGGKTENGRKAIYEYFDETTDTRYRVLTEKNSRGEEVFCDFYTNRNASSSVSSNTSEDAQANNDNALSLAKVGNNSETTKQSSEKFSLREDTFRQQLDEWKKKNGLPKDAEEPVIPVRNPGESAADFGKRLAKYRKEKALWNTAPTFEGHLVYGDEAQAEVNRALQRRSVLARIAYQDSMLPIRMTLDAIMKEHGLKGISPAEDAYTAENRSHGKGKNEFEEYNLLYLEPLRKAYNAMKHILGGSYDNVKNYMMSKHGLERNAHMAFMSALEKDCVDQDGKYDAVEAHDRYSRYKNDVDRVLNDNALANGTIDYRTWRRQDDALRLKYAPSYLDFRYDEMGFPMDYSGLTALYEDAVTGTTDIEEAAWNMVSEVENGHKAETDTLWNAVRAATAKTLKTSFDAGMMTADAYRYVRNMYNNYIPLRGWNGTTADSVWDYVGGGRGAFNQAMEKAEGRKSLADDPIAYIENMAESTILLANKNWVKQHLLLLAENHPTSLLSVSKAWYIKTKDDQGNDIWVPASPEIPADMTDGKQIKAKLDAFEQRMQMLAQTGDAKTQRGRLNIVYPQTSSEMHEHEVRVMRDGEEYVIYVNGDPQVAQAINGARARRVRENSSGVLDRAMAWLGRKMAAVYTSLSPAFVPANFARDLTMVSASSAIREDARYNYLLYKNMAKVGNFFKLFNQIANFQNGNLREKVQNGTASKTEQMLYEFMMNGGETGFITTMQVEEFKNKIQNELKDLDRKWYNPIKAYHASMEGIEYLNRVIEDSNRFLIYMTSRDYGRSIEESVNNAKDVTLNFNRKGTGEYGMQLMRNLYLFINPAVQSLQVLCKLAKDHPVAFTAVTGSWTLSGAVAPVLNSILTSLFGDDEDKDKYWEFSKWDRRNNFIIFIPFTHTFLKIPLAQEFRGFYALGDMIASKLMGGEKAEETWSEYAEDMLGQVIDLLPLDPTGYDGNVALSLTPNPIRPIGELAFNVDFTGKPIFKDNDNNKYDPNWTKAYAGTPHWLTMASRGVNSIGNDYPDVQQNWIDRLGNPRFNPNNPAVTDHLLSSYLGGAYTFVSQAIGLAAKKGDNIIFGNDDAEIKAADIPVWSRFFVNPSDRPVTKRQGNEFWEMKERQERMDNTIRKLKAQAKADGDFSLLKKFYTSDDYYEYKQNVPKLKQFEEERKKEKLDALGEGDTYKAPKTTYNDIYEHYTTRMDDFEDMKLKTLTTKIKAYKNVYEEMKRSAPSQKDAYYQKWKDAIDLFADPEYVRLTELLKDTKKTMLLPSGKDGFTNKAMDDIRSTRKALLRMVEAKAETVIAKEKKMTENQ